MWASLAPRAPARFNQSWVLPSSALAALAAGFSIQQQSSVAQADAAGASGALNPKDFIPLKVIDKSQLTRDTYQLRFELPAGQTSGMNVASCLVTRAMIKNEADAAPKAVIRPYTPTSSSDARGYMDLVVKVYGTGVMSKHIGSLDIGDTLEIKGPIPKFAYKPNMKKHLAMIAGGTGITPMLQVIEEVLANPADNTTIHLMYGNLSEEDIILKDRIDRLVQRHPDQLKVYYVIDDGRWRKAAYQKGIVLGAGRISKDKVQAFIPSPKEDVQIFVCGPPGMMGAISGGKAKDFTQGELSGALAELGYTKDQVFKF